MTATSHETPARPVLLILVAGLAAFTANLDLSIVNLALPAVGRAFGATQSELAWTVNGYVLPYAVSILAVGRLGDGLGHRRLLVAGALLFGLGSIVSAAAPTYPALLAGRVLQGLGGTPCSRSDSRSCRRISSVRTAAARSASISPPAPAPPSSVRSSADC